MKESEPGFSLRYSPESGYCALTGECLGMKLEIIPDGGFSSPVDIKLRIRVPDPAIGLFTVYDKIHDLGICAYPYEPIEYYQDLDPENPPAGYEIARKAYTAAKKMGITSVDVHVTVLASGGGCNCKEKASYRVTL